MITIRQPMITSIKEDEKMKEEYVSPELSVIIFETGNVMVTLSEPETEQVPVP